MSARIRLERLSEKLRMLTSKIQLATSDLELENHLIDNLGRKRMLARELDTGDDFEIVYEGKIQSYTVKNPARQDQHYSEIVAEFGINSKSEKNSVSIPSNWEVLKIQK